MVSPNCVLNQAFCLFICHKDYDHTGNAIYGDITDDADDDDDGENWDGGPLMIIMVAVVGRRHMFRQ